MGSANRDTDAAVAPFSMVKRLVPEELWTIVEPLLPPEPPKPNGGRLRVPDRAALAGIIYVLKMLKSGIPWGMLPRGLGFGSGGDVLETTQRLAEGRGVASLAPRAVGRTGQNRTDRLVEG
jgi:hypothetical protein